VVEEFIMKVIRFVSSALVSLILIFLLVFQTAARISPRKTPLQVTASSSARKELIDRSRIDAAGSAIVGPNIPQEPEVDGATRSFLMRMGEPDSVRRQVAEAVLKTVGSKKGFKIVGVGSWITGKKFVEGTSDFDMRLVLDGNPSEAEAIRAWSEGREALITNVRATCGNKADQVLAKINLYPPEAILEGIDDAEEALSKLTNQVRINPNLGGATTEGLWGKGAKAFRDTYESTAGRAFWREGENITSGFADLLPIGETRGAYTIGGTANTASQFADKVDEALKQYDAKTVKKQLNRLNASLKKSRDLARMEKSTYLDDLLKKLNAFGDTPEGIEALRKELINPAKRQAIDNAIGHAKMDSQLLKMFAESSNPRDLKILQEMLEEGTGKWARVKNAFSKASSYVPWGGLLKAFMAYMVIIQVNQVTSDWKAGDYEKAFQSLLTDAGFMVSFPAGMMAMMVSSIIEDAKDAGYSLVTRFQDCEDLLAGIYEVKGREQISNDQKAETNIAQLAIKYSEKDEIARIVADHARLAASRAEGGKETQKVDAELEKKLIARCTPEVTGKWANKRAELIGDATAILNSIDNGMGKAYGIGNVSPDPAVLRNGRAEVEARASFSSNGSAESDLIQKYVSALRDLGGDKHVVAVSVKHSYRWFRDGMQIAFNEKDLTPGMAIFDRDLVSHKLSFDDTDPHTAQLEYKLSIDVMTSADDVMAAKGFLTRTISKTVPFQISMIGAETAKSTPTPTPSSVPEKAGKIELVVAPAEVTATEKFTVRAKLPPDIAAAARSFGWYSSADLVNWEGERWLTSGAEAVMLFGPKAGRSNSQSFDPNQKIRFSAFDAQKRELGRAEVTIKLKPIALQASAMSSWEWSADSAGIHLKRKPAAKKARCGDKDCTATVAANIDITWCESSPANADELTKTVGSMHSGFLRTQYHGVTPGKEESITIAGFKGSLANKAPQSYAEGNPEGLVDLAFPAVTSFAGGVVMKDGVAICFKGRAWGTGTRLGEFGKFWFDDSPFVNQQGRAAYREMMAILNSVTLGPDANVKQLPYKGPALDGSDLPSLKLVLSPNNKKLRKGDVVNVQAVVEHDENAENPLRYEWTGDHAGSGASVQFLASKPGKQTLAVNVMDVGSAAVEFEVEDLQAKITQVSPSAPKITVGSTATFSAQLLSGGQPLSGNYIYRWQPTPDVKFDPAEGPASQAKAIFSRPGRQKIFVQVIEKTGAGLQTVAESDRIEIEVISPDFKITFEPQSVQVGKEVKAVIQLQPADIKDIDIRWELTRNGKLLRESLDKREITFAPQDTEPVTVTARARVPFTGDDLGTQTAAITATKFDVKVSVFGPEGPKPQIWKDGIGLIPLETALAVNQLVGVRADVTPTQDGLRYEWSLNEDSHFASNNLSQQIRVSRSQTGSCEATVKVRDQNGIELGRGTGTFEVTVSQADIDNGKRRASAAERTDQAKALVAEGKLDEGIAVADEATGLDPKNTEATNLSSKWKAERITVQNQLSQMRSLMDQKKFADAAKPLAAAKQLHPKYGPVLNAETDLAMRSAKDDSAKRESDTQLKLGDEHYEKKNFPAAIDAYNKALVADPGSAAAYAGRCLAKRGAGDASASADCDIALKLDPNNADAYRGRSMIRRGNSDFAGAVVDATRSIELKPGNYSAYLTRGLAKEGLNDLSGAAEDYSEAIQLNPGYAMSFNYRASVRLSLNDNAGAIDDLNVAIQLNPDNPVSWYNRGVAKSNLKDHAGALADYDRAIQLDPKHTIAYYSRGTAKLNLGDNGGAIADLDQFLTTNSKSSNGFNNRGLAHERLGNRDRAIADYETAISIDANNEIAKANLARIKETGAVIKTDQPPPASGSFYPLDLTPIGGKKGQPRDMKGVQVDDGSYARLKSTDENRLTYTIRIPDQFQAVAVAVVSNLDDSINVPQGQTIARMTVIKSNGEEGFNIQAGVHSSEWNAGDGATKHKPADPLFTFQLAQPGTITAIRFDYVETNAEKWWGHAPGFCLRGVTLIGTGLPGPVTPPIDTTKPSTSGGNLAVLDSPERGRLARWADKFDPGVNPAFTFEEVPSGGTTAIRTRAVGNTFAACETKWIKRVFDTGLLNSRNMMLEFDADFAFSGTLYNLPTIGIELLDAGGNSLGMKQFFGKNIIGDFNRSKLPSTGHIELDSATGVHLVPLSRIGANIDFSKIAVYLMNYTCQGENSIILRRVEIKPATR